MAKEQSRRQKKVGNEILRNLSQIFLREGASLFHGSMVTVTEVAMTPDLMEARVYVSIFNAKDEQQILDSLNAARFDIRHKLGSEMRHQLRRIPELGFYKDDSLDKVYRMEEIFKDL